MPEYSGGGGPVKSSPKVSLKPYRDPLRDVQGLTPERVDQGVDYTGTGPVYALGPGVVEQVFNSGWPGGAFIAIRLTDGPLKDHYVYTAENIAPAVSVGDRVDETTVIGQMSGGIETGFAAPPPNLGQALAYIEGQSNYEGDPGAHPTTLGAAYAKILTELGAPSGTLDSSPVGSLPGWLKDWNPLTGLLPGGSSAIGSIAAGVSDAQGLFGIAHWLGLIVSALTDVHLWISLGWLVLGITLMIAGIYLLIRTSGAYRSAEGEITGALLAAAK